MSSELPAGVVTFLFTDIEGSTRLWERYPDQMGEALHRHMQLLRQSIECYQGHVFKTVGDAVYAVFEDGNAALRAALAGQRALHAEAWVGIDELRVRMGLHCGPAEQRDGDYFGPTLSRAARLCAAGHGGQILLSASLYAQVAPALLPPLELRDMGQHLLKGLEEPEQIFQLIDPALPSEFPPLETTTPAMSPLPPQATPLIGREGEIAQLCQQLQGPAVRLLTLTGPGGTGKTRLSIQVAHESLAFFKGGVYFVPLASLHDPALLLDVIAQALKIKEGGQLSLLEQVQAHLQKALPQLLLIDNFEQLLPAASLLSTLLVACPTLKILVTSRTLLRLYGEQEYPVPPLPDPSAISLFVARARSVQPHFALTEQNREAITQICARLDGLPLAIELAAVRIKLLSPQAILERLGSRLRLLTGGARDLPARQRTLRGAIEWGYELLPPEERCLFWRLAIFSGSFSLGAAEAICSEVGNNWVDVFEGISLLLDKSLLRSVEQADPSGERRFEMLETIREYALERLVESGEEAALLEQHALYFLAWSEQAAPALQRAEQMEWLERLEAEHDNLRAALEWILRAQRGEEATRFGIALALFWELHSHLSEGRRWMARLLPLSESSPLPQQAQLLRRASALANLQCDYEAAVTLLARSLVLYRTLEDRRGIARALVDLGVVASTRGDEQQARDHFEESLALFRALGDEPGIAMVLNSLGWLHYSQGETEQALLRFEESLQLRRALGERRAIVNSLISLGWILHSQRQLGAGRARFEESLDQARRLGDKSLIASALGGLALIAGTEEAVEEAQRLYEESLALRRDLGDNGGTAFALQGLAGLALKQGQHGRAQALYEECLPLFHTLGDRPNLRGCLIGLAEIAVDEGKHERATTLLGAAETLYPLTRPGRPTPEAQARAWALEILGETRFQEAWVRGQALSFEEALLYALGTGERT